jgi:nucleotide-binding universal stress UspA family protein
MRAPMVGTVPAVDAPVLLCTDGSDLSTAALRAGLELLASGLKPMVVTVVEEPDPTLVTGTGIAGGVMSPEEFDRSVEAAGEEAAATVAAVKQALGLGGADGMVLQGATGAAICAYAEDVGAAAIIIGTRGRGGFKRAVLGSVSDHVVRNAPCPVLVTGSQGVE